jgi:predicted lipoprotein with Yx(FWY)xxD motif
MLRKYVILIAIFLFAVSLASAQDISATVAVGGNDALGAFLVDANGLTLYTFTNDTPNASVCTDQCLDLWPPLTVANADELVVGEGLVGQFGVIPREDIGALQVTVNRQPLYTFADDSAPGDANGQELFGVWFVARPQTVGLGGNDDLGAFLVAANGMTLYDFGIDTPGVSNCTDQCIEIWPPLTVASADELYAGLGAVAPDDLGLITRADSGALQVTYRDRPLYFYIEDSEPGDANGQGFGDVWFVVRPRVIQTSESETAGTIFTGSDGRTLYTFANDEPGVSNCVDQCAMFWLPLMVSSETDLRGIAAELGEITLIERADGSLQVALNGQALYFFVNDGAPGDLNGQGLNDVWFAAQAGASGSACTITGTNVNLRRGPGTNYDIAGAMTADQALSATGQARGSDGLVWYQLENGAWARSDIVTAEGDCSSVPTVAAPPPPPPPPPPTPLPAPTQAPAAPPPPPPPPPATTEEP